MHQPDDKIGFTQTLRCVLQACNPHVLHSPGRRRSSAGYKTPDGTRWHDDSDLHSSRHAQEHAAEDLNALQRVLAVISRGEVATFLVMAVMFGYGMGTIDSFMFIYLRELGTAQITQNGFVLSKPPSAVYCKCRSLS